MQDSTSLNLDLCTLAKEWLNIFIPPLRNITKIIAPCEFIFDHILKNISCLLFAPSHQPGLGGWSRNPEWGVDFTCSSSNCFHEWTSSPCKLAFARFFPEIRVYLASCSDCKSTASWSYQSVNTTYHPVKHAHQQECLDYQLRRRVIS